MPSIREVMSTDVETVTPDATAQEAAALMLSADTGAIPVVDGERVTGMITDRDIAVRGVAQGRGPETPVRDLMSKDALVTASPDDDIEQVAIRMSDQQVRRLPVVDQEGRLVGIVSLADVSRSDLGEAANVALGGITDPGGEHNQSDAAGNGTGNPLPM